MTDVITFGQRIATIWRELVEHLNEVSAREVDGSSPYDTALPEVVSAQ